MLPEVEAYFAVMGDNDDNYNAMRQAERDNPVPNWSVSLSKEERDAYYAADNKRQAAVRKVNHDWKERQAQALQGLYKSENALVSWIGKNSAARREYPQHVDEVLKALPMTREEMEEFGELKGWCSEYNRFLRLAERAGVLPEAAPEIADFEPLIAELENWYSGNSKRYRGMIRKHLPAILESAQKRAAEKSPATV